MKHKKLVLFFALSLLVLSAFVLSSNDVTLAVNNFIASRLVQAGVSLPTGGAESAPSLAPSTSFPGIGDDTTTSLGQVKIFINPPFRSLMTGFPGYDSTTGRFTSLVLYDPSTKIGRSDPMTEGSGADTGGTPVGTANTMISDSSYLLMPSGFAGSAGTREVHTEVRTFDLAGFGAHIRAGTAITLSNKVSPGEVQSNSSSGDPSMDFPARSFFDVFVEADLPSGGGFPGGTIYNPYPLIVSNNSISVFPPKVVYIHGNTKAVPVLFRDDDPGGKWKAGQLFGWLVLAGHGIGFSNSLTDMTAFQQFMATQPEMPLPCTADDLNQDGQLDSADTSLVANHWHGTYNPQYDVGLGGPDGRILIDDVQRMGGCQGITPAGKYDPIAIQPGYDLFQTPFGGTAITIPVGSPIPQGFFGTKGGFPSDPVSGTVPLVGVPLTSTIPSGNRDFQPNGPFSEVALLAQHGVISTLPNHIGQTDTIVQRLTGLTLGDAPVSGTIPIELAQLSLTSVNPIQVTYPFTIPSLFNVSVVLPTQTQSQGAITISRTAGFSGTFMSMLPVRSVVTFTNLNGTGGTDQPQGPITRTQDIFYSGLGINSPLGSSHDTGPPVPWTLTPSVPGTDPGVSLPSGRVSQPLPLLTPTISVQPSSQSVKQGNAFTVSISVSNATNLGAFEFTLGFDPTLVDAASATMAPSNFLASTGRTVSTPAASPIISNTVGTIIFGAYSTGAQPGPNGNGVLATVTLHAHGGGVSNLTLTNTITNPLQLTDTSGTLSAVQSSNGQVIIPTLFLPLIKK